MSNACILVYKYTVGDKTVGVLPQSGFCVYLYLCLIRKRLGRPARNADATLKRRQSTRICSAANAGEYGLHNDVDHCAVTGASTYSSKRISFPACARAKLRAHSRRTNSKLNPCAHQVFARGSHRYEERALHHCSAATPGEQQYVLQEPHFHRPALEAVEVHALVSCESLMAQAIGCVPSARALQIDSPALVLPTVCAADTPLLRANHSLHPETNMHSYVYIGGEYIGDGFSLLPGNIDDGKLEAKLVAAGAQHNAACGAAARCDAKHLITDKVRKKLHEVISKAPVVLYGWGGCPCTSDARTRFRNDGVCYVETVWPDRIDPLFHYLQCLYGDDNHSFVFIGGKFIGNGFVLGPRAMTEANFQRLLKKAKAAKTCSKQSDKSLNHKLLRPCTQSQDGTTTGWTRSGSCNWDPTDGGYHEVCVTMSDKFLKASAKKDGNDLSSVVQAGGHWCICAWAFAGAVARDPEHIEGIELACDRTNEKLRGVYQHFIDAGRKLTAPSGVQYEAGAALKKVNEICEKRRRLRGERNGTTVRSTGLWRP